MSKAVLLVASILMLISCSSKSLDDILPPVPDPGTEKPDTTSDASNDSIKAPIAGYKLVWHDEFNESSLSSSDWYYERWDAGRVNNELQRYVKDDEVATLKNGVLTLHLIKDSQGYKSARLYAHKGSGWRYGYIEARLRLPKGKGTWPAFWMMPVNFNNDWPASGEIDIMEHVGFDQNVIHSTIHCTKYNNSNTSIETATKRVSDVSGKYHTYGMEWTSEYMRFYIDGASFFTYRNDGTGKDAWPFDSYFYPILNIAYGGDWGGQRGLDDSALPATMDVDYIRVFQK